ncbi:MAG: DNA mismatch repair endonuclease MutL [Vulcanimicrobiaceae bacterium]
MIRLLDPQTVGQIAAGEIIERPASVVKELVENAVDAGAHRIVVAIDAGGLDAIEVIDDGAGILPEDLELALLRHATSKLSAACDLESVATLGFRGEGLASIAAVARVEIISRVAHAQIGTRVAGHAESIEPLGPVAAPIGTRVRVEALFENVPVRREYMRGSAAEFNRISGWLSTFALAYPQITFVLRHDGRDVWTLPSSGDVQQRLTMVFGKAATDGLIPIGADAVATLPGRLSGYVSAPGSDRPDRRMQVLFVNGRLLRSGVLAGAWSAGYSTFAMLGRHPYGVLFLELPAEHVDPNVHPTKTDVRLRYANQVFEAVRNAISTTLHGHAVRRFGDRVGGDTPGRTQAPVTVSALFPEMSVPPSAVDRTRDGRLRVLEQIAATYILATDGQALVLVDQHAAHERVAYEQIVARAKAMMANEPLLVPLVLELSPQQSRVLDGMLEFLREGGLQIEPFGERSYRLVATPAGYGARPFDMAGLLADLAGEAPQRSVRERVWASLACHSVTVAGERLEFEEMSTLLERLQRCENPMHCPHGRPTLVRFGADELARFFKRI